MNWVPLAILTAGAFALYNFFIKLGSGRIHEVLGAVVLQVSAAVLGAGFALALRLSGRPLPSTGRGLLWSVLAGVAVGIAEVLTFLVFSRGAPVSLGTPVILGGSVVGVAVLGALVLREPLRLPQLAGMVLIVAGIALLSSPARLRP